MYAHMGLERGKNSEKMGIFVVYIDVDNIDISISLYVHLASI